MGMQQAKPKSMIYAAIRRFCDVYSQSQMKFHLAKRTVSKKSHHRQKDLNFKIVGYSLGKISLGQ
jgi:hypothetical protein